MIDFYTMLYLPASRKGHVWQLLAEALGVSVKTVKRMAARWSRSWDRAFWAENGFLSDDDWQDLKTIWRLTGLPGAEPVDEPPTYIRELHPSVISYALRLHGFEIGALRQADHPPLLAPAVDYAAGQMHRLSKIYFSLLKKDFSQYQQQVDALHSPVPFPTENVRAEFYARGKIVSALDAYYRELALFGSLVLDLSVVTWTLGSEQKGASYLIGGVRALANNQPTNSRRCFFDGLKREVAKRSEQQGRQPQRRQPPGTISNREFYACLARHEGEEEAIKKQCARIYKAKHPTPKDLDSFLDRCFTFLGLDYPEERERHLGIYRNRFTHYLMLERLVAETVGTGRYASPADLLSRLIFFRQWLCAEVFHCPVELPGLED